jgi:hypothetical protein
MEVRSLNEKQLRKLVLVRTQMYRRLVRRQDRLLRSMRSLRLREIKTSIWISEIGVHRILH